MSDYFNKTEEQEFNDAKAWFKENGKPIIAAIVVALLAGAGWNFWKSHQYEKALKTSANYQQVMDNYLQNPAQNAPLVEQFIADNKGSSYAIFAQLEEAKRLVETNDFANAKIQLQQALANNSDSTLQNIIRLRLATVDFQLQNYEEALATLTNVKDEAWSFRKKLLQGDILVAKGEIDAAKTAYNQAKVIASEQDRVLIDLRLNNL